MAKLVVKNAFVSLGGTDYSAQIKGATLTITAPEVDVTNFAGNGWVELISGNLKGTLALEFVKDSDLSGLDAAIYAILSHATVNTMAFLVKLQSAAASTANPSYAGTILVNNWSPVAGSVGQAFGGSITFPVTGAITRATAP